MLLLVASENNLKLIKINYYKFSTEMVLKSGEKVEIYFIKQMNYDKFIC